MEFIDKKIQNMEGVLTAQKRVCKLSNPGFWKRAILMKLD